MKKILIALIIVVGTATVPFAGHADTTTSCVRVGNTVRCSTSPDIQAQLNALKNQYGLKNYYACYDRGGFAHRDTSSPPAQQSMYSYMKYCLEKMSMPKASDPAVDKAVEMLGGDKTPENPADACSDNVKYPNGATWFNGRCVDYDTYCKESNKSDNYRSYKKSGMVYCEKVVIAPSAPVVPKPQLKPTPKVEQKEQKVIQPVTSVEPELKTAKQGESAPEIKPQEEAKPSFFKRVLNFFKKLFK